MAKGLSEITCKECGEKAHILINHIYAAHLDLCDEMEEDDALAAYQKKYPGEPILSDFAKDHLAKKADVLRNDRAKFSISKTFGIKLKKDKEVGGWEKPWPNTPKIDPDYYFDKWLLNAILFVLENQNERMMLTGPTGSGKSSSVEQVCARLRLPMYRMNFDGEIGRSEFVGQYVVTGQDKMEFVYGVLPRAMREGAVLILDEYDMMRDDVNGVLQAILEGKPLVILETGESIAPHPNFRVFATANTVGGGDETGLYVGTNVVNYAQRDRWTICREVDYPSAKIEQKIILNKTNIGAFANENGADPKGLIEKFLNTAKSIRDSFKKDEITCTMSTRSIVNVAHKLTVFGDVREAWNMAYINKLNTDDKNFVNEIVQRIWGI